MLVSIHAYTHTGLPFECQTRVRSATTPFQIAEVKALDLYGKCESIYRRPELLSTYCTVVINFFTLTDK